MAPFRGAAWALHVACICRFVPHYAGAAWKSPPPGAVKQGPLPPFEADAPPWVPVGQGKYRKNNSVMRPEVFSA